jgi:PAS domain S-box-containing protein
MLGLWSVSIAAAIYLGLLFAIASFGDRNAFRLRHSRWEPLVYALSFGVYCTSWTFYGSVGRAAASGIDFILIYVGPALMLLVGLPFLRKLVRTAQANNITSIADFIGARYGKSQFIAALVTVIAVIGVLPYIALQLQAVTLSFDALVHPSSLQGIGAHPVPVLKDTAFYTAIAMAAFAVLFGLRHVHASERHQGLMMAIAFESLVKLGAFVALGLFVTTSLSSQLPPLTDVFGPAVAPDVRLPPAAPAPSWFSITLVAAFAFVLLPRQFQVAVVESSGPANLKRAAWIFPVYLLVINLFVPAIAVAGLKSFQGAAPPDLFVLMLPMANHQSALSLAVFLGGLSASTSMVIVEAVALSTMICNELIVPLWWRHAALRPSYEATMGRLVLRIRRAAVFAVLLGAYAYHLAVGDRYPLASIGLISMSAVAQFAPPVALGLYWRGAHRYGAIAGITAGALIWAYSLLMPSLLAAGWLSPGIGLGLPALPSLFPDLDALTNGVLWSLSVNTLLMVVVSNFSRGTEKDRRQAAGFVGGRQAEPDGSLAPLHDAAFDDLKALVERIVGRERADKAFAGPIEAYRDRDLAAHAERVLSGVVGTASAHIMVAAVVRRRGVAIGATRALLDEASKAILFNHGLLRATLENVPVLITYVDKDERYRFTNESYASAIGRAGTDLIGLTLREVLSESRYARLAPYIAGALAGQRQTFEIDFPQIGIELALGTYVPHLDDDGKVIGFFTLYQDITELRRAAEAKSAAEAANVSKTHFLAAASHDLLQPLHVARLLTGALAEKHQSGRSGKLVAQLERALGSVDELLRALLDISKLDAGALQPQVRHVHVEDVLCDVVGSFEPMAAQRGLSLRRVSSSAIVATDPALLRRILQNFISNALRYTRQGKVLVGCRRRGQQLLIEVWDTGCGIPDDQHGVIFEEFKRVGQADPQVAPGLGLGLAIVDRMARLLGHPVRLRSWPGRGSVFSVQVPCGDPLAAVQAPGGSGRTAPNSLAGKVVLCIDNEPAVLAAARGLLEGWSCRVLTATSASGALAELAASSAMPDVILLDYHLEGSLTGFEAISEIVSLLGRAPPTILVTANYTDEVREAASARGYPVLNKPVKPGALRALIAQTLSDARPRQAG